MSESTPLETLSKSIDAAIKKYRNDLREQGKYLRRLSVAYDPTPNEAALEPVLSITGDIYPVGEDDPEPRPTIRAFLNEGIAPCQSPAVE